jgi:hypothetical protein
MPMREEWNEEMGRKKWGGRKLERLVGDGDLLGGGDRSGEGDIWKWCHDWEGKGEVRRERATTMPPPSPSPSPPPPPHRVVTDSSTTIDVRN